MIQTRKGGREPIANGHANKVYQLIPTGGNRLEMWVLAWFVHQLLYCVHKSIHKLVTVLNQ